MNNVNSLEKYLNESYIETRNNKQAQPYMKEKSSNQQGLILTYWIFFHKPKKQN